MKRSYEIPVVFRVMPEDETQQAVDQVIAWMENSTEGVENAGSVTRIDRTRLGRRRLAYEINGQRDGFYVLFYADVDARHLPEFELNMRLYDPVLRYLIVKHDETVAPEQSAPAAVPEPVEDEINKETENFDADEADSEDDDA